MSKRYNNNKVNNGNRYIIDESSNTSFGRDADRLFLEYKNLRNKLYQKYKNNFKDNETKRELRSYIDEQFITLVKEYDINSPVDFPGYIKKKLYARVSQTFVRGNKRNTSREFTLSDENKIQETLEEGSTVETELDVLTLVEDLFSNVNLSKEEETILFKMLQHKPDSKIKKEMKEEYKVSPEEVGILIEELREYTRNELNLTDY